MSGVRRLSLLLVMGVAAVAMAGDIQVSCPPGLRVYLDGELAGISSAQEDGLYLMNVANGGHDVRVEKDHYLPQSFQVQVRDLPIEVKVEELSPAPPEKPAAHEVAEPEVTELVGSLVITSAPQNCVVEIDGRTETKSTPHLSIGGIAAGEHTISFSKQGYDPISDVVRIQPGAEVLVRGNLKEGKVEVVHRGEGSLVVTSKPMRCNVRFLGKTHQKSRQKLKLSYIPAGEHLITVSLGARTLTAEVLIKNGQRTYLAVSFMAEDVPFAVSFQPEKK